MNFSGISSKQAWDSENPWRHVAKWRERITEAPFKDPAFLERDETLWTAGALLALHRSQREQAWISPLSRLFGPVPPFSERLEWHDLMTAELQLFFEVGLSSPCAYRQWLRDHLD